MNLCAANSHSIWCYAIPHELNETAVETNSFTGEDHRNFSGGKSLVILDKLVPILNAELWRQFLSLYPNT